MLDDRGHSEPVIVLVLVQFIGFREIRHQTRNYPPKYLVYSWHASNEKYRVLCITRDMT